MPYKFLCDMKILCSIQNLLYMVVGRLVSRKACDKVLLNGRIWSLVNVTEIMQCRLSMSCEDRVLLRRELVQPRASHIPCVMPVM